MGWPAAGIDGVSLHSDFAKECKAVEYNSSDNQCSLAFATAARSAFHVSCCGPRAVLCRGGAMPSSCTSSASCIQNFLLYHDACREKAGVASWWDDTLMRAEDMDSFRSTCQMTVDGNDLWFNGH